MKKKQKDKRNTKLIIKVFKWTVAILLLFVCIAGVYIGKKLYDIKTSALEIMKERDESAYDGSPFKENLTTLIYDKNGDILANLSNDKDAYYMEFKDIPYMVKQIFIITEDRDFYEHSGVDYKAVARAVIELVKNEGEITQGGSTITQQLARNIYLSHEVSVKRKLQEIFIAKELEDKYSKDTILEYYINDIYFANGLYGVQAASKGYFGKDVCELTLSELCFVCAIPNNPELYNPILNYDNTIKRRNRILDQLKEYKIINGTDYEEAVAEEIVLNPGEKVKNNYEETFVRYSVTRELMEYYGFEFKYDFANEDEREQYLEEYNEKYSQCNEMLFAGGYRIYTSIDRDKQNALQEALDNQLSVDDTVNEEGIYKLQGSAVCIDNSNGFVVAVVGGRTQDTKGYTLNRAYQSFRQPGSSIKPILIYTPLFERGYSPDSIVVDEKIPGGPVNSPNIYSGNITVRTALTYSKNTIAWKLFDMMGCYTCINYLKNMQFSHISRDDYVPAMSIGGMTYGVSALEMASAFCTLENNGEYRSPTCVIKITDSFGNEIIDNTKNQDEKQVYEKNASLMTTNVLKDVLTMGTGKDYQIESAICAGKTGTTNDNKDCWFAGYSKYYTTAVWCGYDMPKEMEGTLPKSAGYIWKNYMENIHMGLEKKDFDEYMDISNPKNEAEPETEDSIEEETPENTYDDSGMDNNTEEESSENIDNDYSDGTENQENIQTPAEGDDGLYIE